MNKYATILLVFASLYAMIDLSLTMMDHLYQLSNADLTLFLWSFWTLVIVVYVWLVLSATEEVGLDSPSTKKAEQ
jgi:Na+/H+ antiporter NhaC